MAERLRQIAEAVDPRSLPFVVNDRRVEMYREQLTQTKDFNQRVKLEFAIATELLYDGRNATDAIAAIDSLTKSVELGHLTPTKEDRISLRMLRAQAYLRMGEQENCCSRHTPDSCLLPLRGSAIYTRQEGPRRAIEVLKEELAEFPEDLGSQWLLNVAYMTLGEYPAGVPKQFLIDPKAFESEYDIKTFPDVGAGVGLDTYGLSGGCIVDDFDGDGRLDVVRSDSRAQPGNCASSATTATASFNDRTEEAGLIGEVGGLNLIQADYDNDGHLGHPRASRRMVRARRPLSAFAAAK